VLARTYSKEVLNKESFAVDRLVDRAAPVACSSATTPPLQCRNVPVMRPNTTILTLLLWKFTGASESAFIQFFYFCEIAVQTSARGLLYFPLYFSKESIRKRGVMGVPLKPLIYKELLAIKRD